MRIDEALAESKPLAVQFPKGVLNIQYRPFAYTIEQMVEAQKDQENPETLLTMVMDLVQGWDLTRMEKVVSPDGFESFEREVPVDVTSRDDLYRYVPSPVYHAIIKAIKADNDVSGE